MAAFIEKIVEERTAIVAGKSDCRARGTRGRISQEYGRSPSGADCDLWKVVCERLSRSHCTRSNYEDQTEKDALHSRSPPVDYVLLSAREVPRRKTHFYVGVDGRELAPKGIEGT